MTVLVLVSIAVIVYIAVRKGLVSRIDLPTRRLVRKARVFAGEYELKDLVEEMVELALGSAVPSLTRSFLPAYLKFGVSAQDASRWGDLFDRVATELTAVISQRAELASLTLPEKLSVIVSVDAEARPGHPRLAAMMLAPEAPNDRRVAPSPPAAADTATLEAPGPQRIPVRKGTTSSGPVFG